LFLVKEVHSNNFSPYLRRFVSIVNTSFEEKLLVSHKNMCYTLPVAVHLEKFFSFFR